MDALLSVRNIDKNYDGVQALADVSLDVAAGEVHALMGENGAGKSTLGKIIAGVVAPSRGTIHFEGRPIALRNPMDAQRLGISIIFQELDLFPNLSVAENIVIGNLNMQRGAFVNFQALERYCRPFLDQVGLDIPGQTPLGSLPIGQMQLVAIARALSMNARLIVMDEPTSSLTRDAVDVLFRLIGKLKDSGVSIIYVSHKMDEIFRIADRVTVLRDGGFIETVRTDQTDVDNLIRMMVGRSISSADRLASRCTSEVLLSARGLRTSRLRDVSFELHRGEVLGLAGLVGAGRSELGNALFGLDRLGSGQLEIKGEPVRIRSPRQAIDAGLGLLPEDRKLQGLMMQMSVRENAALSIMRRLTRLGFVLAGREREAVDAMARRTAIKAASPEVSVNTLSGGNQQKVLLARWLLVDPDVIFLDDPTRGIDVGAKEDIYAIIGELAAAGKGVLLVSSELPELLRCCDRIMVLHDGENMGILDARQTTQEAIMALATRCPEHCLEH